MLEEGLITVTSVRQAKNWTCQSTRRLSSTNARSLFCPRTVRGKPTADVFVSYASADRDVAEALAEQLQADGRSVWWDVETAPGASFREEIAKQLNAAKTVIVIWTPASVQSQWVISEAQRAAAQNKLIPVRAPDVDIHSIPQPFDTLHTPIVSENVIAAIKVRPRSRSWLSARYFIGMIVRLSIVVAVIAGAIDAVRRWNEYALSTRATTIDGGTAYECAAKLPRETVAKSLNSFAQLLMQPNSVAAADRRASGFR